MLLDFSTAFDKVPHQHFILELHNYGIRGNVLDWISSFLSNHTQHVVSGGFASDLVDKLSGVSQGTVLGLCFFWSI